MVKKGQAYYGIRKGRGAPVVITSWAEVVEKVRVLKTRKLFPLPQSVTLVVRREIA